MALKIKLTKGRLTAALFKSFEDYYQRIGIDRGFTTRKWEHWKNSPHITVYKASKGNELLGWIIYDPDRSTIEEVLTPSGRKKTTPAIQMIDALIAKENLLAAEILEEDKEKYKNHSICRLLFFYHRHAKL